MVWEEYLTMLVLSGANGMNFQGMKDHLENSSLFGQDIYPPTGEQLLNMLNNYKPEVLKVWSYPPGGEVVFIQTSETASGLEK